MGLIFSETENDLFGECFLQTMRLAAGQTASGGLKGALLNGPLADTGEHYAMVECFEAMGVGGRESPSRIVSCVSGGEVREVLEGDTARFGLDLPWLLDLFLGIAKYRPEAKTICGRDLDEPFALPDGLQRMFLLLEATGIARQAGNCWAWTDAAALQLVVHQTSISSASDLMKAAHRQVALMIDLVPPALAAPVVEAGEDMAAGTRAASRAILEHWYGGRWNREPAGLLAGRLAETGHMPDGVSWAGDCFYDRMQGRARYLSNARTVQ